MITMDKKAVLHLQIELNKTCGVTRSILRIIKNSHNFEHHVISLKGDALERFKGYNVRLINADRKSFVGTLTIFFSILYYVKQNNIRIIHSHHRYFDLLSFFMKRFSPVKTVITVHSKVFNKKLFSYKSDKILVVSNAIKLHLMENFNVDPVNIHLINNFVDKNEINITLNKKEIFSEIGLNQELQLIGYFGRLDIKEKGVDVLLNALEMVTKINPSVFLILAGNGIDEIELKKSALEKKLPVMFLGNIDNIWNYLNACDIVILPSRIEPFNLVMIEAGLLGKPVIGAEVDGIAETLKDHITGILFCKENADDLKNKTIELLSDKNLMERIGSNIKDMVQNGYSPENIIPLIEEIYRGLLQQE
jgi:glycosyltransferase involved in cell wall biosynthesis